jgi:uncharacterized protein YndB with AHSA1/START domain
MATTLPVTSSVDVEAPPDRAFAVFTAGIAEWWPLDRMGVFRDGTVSFDQDAIVEESPSGEQTTWGEVTAWQPPELLAFTWHPGRDEGPPTTVHVGLVANDDDGTTVTLVHAGWDDIEDGAAMRDEYERGWAAILERYRDVANG